MWENWQGTLLVTAIIVFSVIFNSLLATRLPYIEGILLMVHVAGFLAIIIPLWVMAPRASVHSVLFEFTDGGGWGIVDLSTMVGIPIPCAMLYVSAPFDSVNSEAPSSSL